MPSYFSFPVLNPASAVIYSRGGSGDALFQIQDAIDVSCAKKPNIIPIRRGDVQLPFQVKSIRVTQSAKQHSACKELTCESRSKFPGYQGCFSLSLSLSVLLPRRLDTVRGRTIISQSVPPSQSLEGSGHVFSPNEGVQFINFYGKRSDIA